MFFNLAATFIIIALVQATTAAQFNVVVGGSANVFTPEFVNASVGDIVTFTFMQKNHTVTQSTLTNPCQMSPGGFDSGFVPVAANNTNGPFTIAQFPVQDTNPVWVYCRQGNHCQQGMVFAINPGNNFAAFKAAAMGTGASSSASSSAPTITQTISATASATNPGPSVPSSMSSDHKIVVGGTGLTFQPANITAQVGDTVTFQFMQKNHTATQSTFANPCQRMAQNVTTGLAGFDSGFMAVAVGATVFPTYTIQVNNTAPIWVYCKQANHCSQGMVFAVNAVESGPNNFEAFVSRASATGNSSGNTTTPTSGAGQVGVNVGILSALVMSLWIVI